MKQKIPVLLAACLAATQLPLASADSAGSATTVLAQSGYGAEEAREQGDKWRVKGKDKIKKEKHQQDKNRDGRPGSDGSKGNEGSKGSDASRGSDGSKGSDGSHDSGRDKVRDNKSRAERGHEHVDTKDGRAMPQGLEKQREKKAGQQQNELDKGSERGKEARQGRKKWWQFWVGEEEQ